MKNDRQPAIAWVESPLQLLGVVEFAAATEIQVRVIPRAGALQLPATVTRVRHLGLPANVTIERPRLSPAPVMAALRNHWIVGDAFSGQVRSALAIRQPNRITIVDDGAISLRIDDVLDGTAVLERATGVEAPHVRALGRLAQARLHELDTADSLDLFSCFPLRHRSLRPNRFEWLRSRSPRKSPTSRIVLGSAAVADGTVDRDRYLAWIATLALPAAYYPHRREDAAVLAHLRSAPSLTVVETGLPIELELAGSESVRVVSPPSSALRTLAVILDGLDPQLDEQQFAHGVAA